jgi:hypothetical protein
MIRRLLVAADVFFALVRTELVLHRARRAEPDRLRARVDELERRLATRVAPMTPALPRLAARLRIAADYAAFRHDVRALTPSAAVAPMRSPRSPDRRDGGTSLTARQP